MQLRQHLPATPRHPLRAQLRQRKTPLPGLRTLRRMQQQAPLTRLKTPRLALRMRLKMPLRAPPMR